MTPSKLPAQISLDLEMATNLPWICFLYPDIHTWWSNTSTGVPWRYLEYVVALFLAAKKEMDNYY